MKKIFTPFVAAIACVAINANAADFMMIIGDATPGGWSHDGALLMNRSNDNPDLFVYTGYLTADANFKFTTATDWIDDMEYRNPNADPYQIDKLRAGGDDTQFRVAESCNYIVTCNIVDLTVSVVKAEYQENPIRYNSLYLIGDATTAGWELPQAVPMTVDPNDPYLFTAKTELNNSGTFKIGVNPHVGYGQIFFHPEADNKGQITDDGTDDRQWSVAEPDTYIVKTHLLNKTISIDKANSSTAPVIEADLSGTAAAEAPVYYNLQGVRVDNPVSGLYIEVRGTRATKVRL